MRSLRFAVMIAAVTAVAGFCSTASAVSPNNPYRTFNLSGINYGSMRWEQAQQRGQRVWPYYNTPSGRIAAHAPPSAAQSSAAVAWVRSPAAAAPTGPAAAAGVNLLKAHILMCVGAIP